MERNGRQDYWIWIWNWELDTIKKLALEPYKFSVIIENNIDQGFYFSEKLIDCISIFSVPIYWSHGHKNLAQFFIFLVSYFFSYIKELKNIIETANEELQIMAYNQRKDAILYSFQQALWFLDSATYKYPNYQILDGDDGSTGWNVLQYNLI
jgi:hypothetical protein